MMQPLHERGIRTNLHEPIPLRLWVIVLLFTFVTYLRTLTFSFISDDIFLIFGDSRLNSWAHWPRLFTEHLWSPIFDQGSYYRPAILFWLMIQKTLFGTNSTLWHLASVGLHVCVTALVLCVANRILKTPVPAAIAALAFGLHPVHIESVAWASASEPLLALFALAAYLCFLQWNDAHTLGSRTKFFWMTASIVLYGMAQLTKETAIVLPAIIFLSILILGDHPSATFRSKLFGALRITIPYLLCAGLYLLVRFSLLGSILGNTGSESLLELFFTLPGVLLQYVQHLIFPFGLSPLYDTPYVATFSWTLVGIPLALLGLVSAGLFFLAQRSVAGALAIVWLILPLLPVLNLALLSAGDRFHDRFLYLPAVGYVMILGVAMSEIRDTGRHAFGVPVAHLCAAILICAPLAIGTAIQSSHWKDNLHLFRRAVDIAPGNNVARNNLGYELIRASQLDEAEVHLQRVIERAPGYSNSLLNLGRLNFLRGEYELAERHLLRAMNSSENDPDVYLNLGFVHARMGKTDAAEDDFRQALLRNRGRPGYGNALGVFLRNQGRLLEALNAFEAELLLDPAQEDVRREVELLRSRIDAP